MGCGLKLREEGIAHCLDCNICATLDCQNKRDGTNSLCLDCQNERPCANVSRCGNKRSGTKSLPHLCLICQNEFNEDESIFLANVVGTSSRSGRVRNAKPCGDQARVANLCDQTEEGISNGRTTRGSAGGGASSSGAGAGAAAVSQGVVGSPTVQDFEAGRRVYWYALNSGISHKVFGHMVSETLETGQLARSQGISGTIKCKPEAGLLAKNLVFGPRVSKLFLAPEESDEEAMAADEAGAGDFEEDVASDHAPLKRSRDPVGGGPGIASSSATSASASSASAAAAAAPAPAGGSSPERKKGRWSEKEATCFEQALGLYGRKWELVADHVGSRDQKQCQTYAHSGGFFAVQRVFGNK
jgi:hypothetical protein